MYQKLIKKVSNDRYVTWAFFEFLKKNLKKFKKNKKIFHSLDE